MENATGREMPKYKSHKEVSALKIKSIELSKQHTDGSSVITPEEADYDPFIVDAGFISKLNPQVGGYFVVYKNGYQSYSPAEAFEEGNRLISGGLHFGDAVEALKQGKRVQRSGWNGKGMFLVLSEPKENPASGVTSYINGLNDPLPTLPFIVMKTATDELVPWLASQTDVLSEDWSVID